MKWRSVVLRTYLDLNQARISLKFSSRNTRGWSNFPPMSEHKQDTHFKSIGYLLWIFGFIGAHRFYFGKPISGAIWFFTLGLLGIGWLVDLFLIPSMYRQANRRFTPGSYDYSLAWIFQTFVGVLGIHRFYMGKFLTGILWLLTGGLFLVGWFYDFCTLNRQVDEKNRGIS